MFLKLFRAILDFFRITSEPQIDAKDSKISLLELNNLIEQHRVISKKANSNGARPVFIYNEDLTVLYYTAASMNALSLELGIAHDSSNKCIRTGALYLDFLKITTELVYGVNQASISLDELKELLQTKRREKNLRSLSSGRGKNAIPIVVTTESNGETKWFSSTSAASLYLKEKGTPIFVGTITKYLKNGKAYKGYR